MEFDFFEPRPLCETVSKKNKHFLQTEHVFVFCVLCFLEINCATQKKFYVSRAVVNFAKKCREISEAEAGCFTKLLVFFLNTKSQCGVCYCLEASGCV